MNREDLQNLSTIRRRDARALLASKRYAGSYYMMGYAVECALKACIAKKTKLYDFPDLDFSRKVYTHKIDKLLQAAGLSAELKRDLSGNNMLEVNWSIVTDWSEKVRYKRGISRIQAKDFYSACTSRSNGVLPWVRSRW